MTKPTTPLTERELEQRISPKQLQVLCDARLEHWEIAERLGVSNQDVNNAVSRYTRQGRLQLPQDD